MMKLILAIFVLILLPLCVGAGEITIEPETRMKPSRYWENTALKPVDICNPEQNNVEED